MIDLTYQLNLAQIAFFLAVIAISLVYMAFVRKPRRTKNKKEFCQSNLY